MTDLTLSGLANTMPIKMFHADKHAFRCNFQKTIFVFISDISKSKSTNLTAYKCIIFCLSYNTLVSQQLLSLKSSVFVQKCKNLLP